MIQIQSDSIIQEMVEKFPPLKETESDLLVFCKKMITIFDGGGRLFIAGNGGSAADAQHIAGELMKSFERTRKLSEKEKELFLDFIDGNLIADNLENGLPVIVLGLNHSLTSAILNDFNEPHLEFAQELWVLANKKDAFLGISTSGEARNVYCAMVTAKAKGLFVAALTGERESSMKELADLTIQVPSNRTSEVQQMHEVVYHAFCKILEDYYFK